jgi:SAM-dependent methyltransferase
LRAQDYLDFYRHHYRSLYSAAAVPDEDFVREQISRGRGVRRWVEDLCGSVAGWRVYEVGCGAGGILKAFAEAGCRVCGCDFDAAYLAAARRLEIEVFVGGSEAFCGQPPADLVILSHVFEHFWDVRGDLARLRRILAPHGLLYVEVPGIFALRAWRHGDFTRLAQTAHTMHFTLATLTHALERHGFVLISGDELVRALFAARRSTLADIQGAHLRLLENTCSEDVRVSPASFRQAYLRARWENIGHQIGAAETVALYGAGRHTRYLLDCLRGAPGPRVSVILDDESTRNGSNLDGIRVTNDLLGEAQPPAAIVISSDSLETRLASSAHTRYGARWPIFRLYDGLPPGPYPA